MNLTKIPAISIVLLLNFVLYRQVGAQLSLLQDWLTTPVSSRPPLSDQAFARLVLSKAQADSALILLDSDKQSIVNNQHGNEWDTRLLKMDDLEMPFYYQNFGTEPSEGRTLFISLHGGGGTAPSVNDGQYQNQQHLYDATMSNMEGVYLAPRAPTDNWNLWHESHIDDFFNIIIQMAVIKENVNPDKVYVLGYSAGGDGVYQLGPRMADRWAAASMMAGHPNDASPLSLRNTPFAIQVGALDAAYDRNLVAGEWGDQLDVLEAADPGAYIHYVRIHEGKGHWMDLEDAPALPWMQTYIRNPLPEKVVWKQSSRHHTQFYWLGTEEAEIQTGGEIVVEYDTDANEINILENYSGAMQILINDAMLNLDNPVTLKYQGTQIFTGILHRSILNIYESLEVKGDINYGFPVRVTVTDNQTVSENNVDLTSLKPESDRGFIHSVYFSNMGNNLNIIFPARLKGNAVVFISDMQGRLVYNNTGVQSMILDSGSWPRGIYAIKITRGDGVYFKHVARL